MAAGDIVAFIDDDSVPEAEWLVDLAKSYGDSRVGAVGGFVYDHTGVQFQSRFVTVDRLGYSTDRPGPTPHLNFPFSQTIPHLIGTNCSFRRSALIEIGGFDEEYEYFLDETDLCCRINDAGYKIIQRQDAFVHHKFAPSHLRDEERVVKNWYSLIKNRIYFGIRNGLHHHSLNEVTAAGVNDMVGWETAIVNGKEKGIYSENDLERFHREASDALRDGHSRGLESAKYLRHSTLAKYHSPFVPFPVNVYAKDRRVICFLTRNYPSTSDDVITRRTADFAQALAAMGHLVHVLTEATEESASLEYEDGFWLHRLEIKHLPSSDSSPPAPRSPTDVVHDYGRTMLEELSAINKRRNIDLVYCALSDKKPLSFQFAGRFPLAVTPGPSATVNELIKNCEDLAMDRTG